MSDAFKRNTTRFDLPLLAAIVFLTPLLAGWMS